MEKENASLMADSSEGSQETVEEGDRETKVPIAEPMTNTEVSGNGNSGETVYAREEDSYWPDDSKENSEEKKDIYVGEYNDYDIPEPNLEIQKNEDGTYTIQVGVFRTAWLEDGKGILTEEGIEFTATAPNGKEMTGTIVMEEDIAVVTFDKEVWATYSHINEYRYYKISDVPNIR